MKDSTFVKYFKELYPKGYESLVSEFEKYYRSVKNKETRYIKKLKN